MPDNRVQQILSYWFGHVEETVIPSQNRARIWFGEHEDIDNEIKHRFTSDLKNASERQCVDWEADARGQLALIITLDQFSRHIHRGARGAFAQDDYALSVCLDGMSAEIDHDLSLIERVFYYFPLLHSEHMPNQEVSLRAYEMLLELAMPETKVIYESFFKFATLHYTIVNRFGRFPQRNAILGRISTGEEEKYLQDY